MPKLVLVEKKDHVAIITLNRPDKLNAINLQLKNELSRVLDNLEADDDVRVAILTGAGRAFSAGHDLDAPPSEGNEFTCLEEEEKLLTFDKPIIAAVNGYALGDGMQQALLCDILVASERAILGFIGARLGMMCYGAVWNLRETVGWKRASELLLTCKEIGADEAYRIGLVNQVVPHEQLMPAALEMAEQIMKNAPLSLRYSKRMLRRGLFDDEVKASVQKIIKELRASDDFTEVQRAHKEGRAPVFKGK